MRLQAWAWVVAAALQLSACQLLSGLDELHAKPGRKQPAQLTDASHVADAATLEGSSDPSVMSSMVLPKDEGDLEHQGREPERDQPTPMDSDAGPSETEARSNRPRAMSDSGIAGPVVQAADAGASSDGRAHEASAGAGGAAEPDAPENEETAPACSPRPPGGPECSVAPQCGCEAGENCAVEAGRLACMPAGTAEVNQPCERAEDCMLGYQCLSGACLQLCDASRPACDAGSACLQLNAEDGTPIAGAHVCESNCNLVEPDHAVAELSACGSGLVCIWSGTGSYCARSDRARKQHGEQCDAATECAPGFVCTEQGTCAKWCATSRDCPAAFSCKLDAPVQIGQSGFGTCKPDCLGGNEQVCGLSSQCGCDADRSCDSLVNRNNQVVHACRDIGSVPLYEACTTSTDCGRGAQCVSEQCLPLCLSDLECPRYARCELGYFAAAPLVSAGATCQRPCDPAEPYRAHGEYGTCQAGEACDVTTDGASHCRASALRGVAGVSCSLNSDCAIGHTCTSEQACILLCRGDGDCQAGTCRAFATSQYATTVEWGYCASGP